jgi:hypothetical protein
MTFFKSQSNSQTSYLTVIKYILLCSNTYHKKALQIFAGINTTRNIQHTIKSTRGVRHVHRGNLKTEYQSCSKAALPL